VKHSSKDKITVLLVYVDDIIVIGSDEKEKLRLKTQLAQEFKMKELGKLKYFLGIEVAYSRQWIFICQQKCIYLNHKMSQDCKEGIIIDKGRYQRLVVRLIYLSHTRPDITYAIRVVSQFMHDHKEKHLQAIQRILRYLKATPKKGLVFKKGSNLIIALH